MPLSVFNTSRASGEDRIFSRDEKKQDDMYHQLEAKHPDTAKKVKFYIGDVRVHRSVADVMPNVDYIWYAVALKQVSSREFFPMQAVKTNVEGTDNVLHAVIDVGVKRIVCLSTDKAAYPIVDASFLYFFTNIYGIIYSFYFLLKALYTVNFHNLYSGLLKYAKNLVFCANSETILNNGLFFSYLKQSYPYS